MPERRSLSVSGPVLSVFQLRASTLRPFRPGGLLGLYEDESLRRIKDESGLGDAVASLPPKPPVITSYS